MLVAKLNELIKRLLKGIGMKDDYAELVSDVFIRATLRGVGHHDVNNFPRRLELIYEGEAKANPNIKLVKKFNGVESYEGDSGLGELCCAFAMDRAIALAKEFGVGFCTIRHSNHFLSAAPYVERAVERDCLGMVFTNTIPCMAGPSGGKSIIGNNPLGFGSPSGCRVGYAEAAAPFLLDIAMSYASWGRIDEKVAAGEKIPATWARDRDGKPTTDPSNVRNGGTVSPMAEHKGFGLALMSELLTAGLADGEMTGQLQETRGVNTHSQAALAIDIERLIPLDRYSEKIAGMIRSMKQVDDTSRMPGEGSFDKKQRFLNTELPLGEEIVASLEDWAKKLKV